MAEEQAPGADVIRAVDDRCKEVHTRSLDISFNELLDMHGTGELVIDLDYQRLFRWSEGKQSRFIESLILELPIPPIFVVERDEGVYELIDGLQRVSSYLHFRGELPQDAELSEVVTEPRLRLIDCDIVKELNGLTFEDLPTALQIRLKRSFVRMEVIRRESDKRLRYYMFKRLNTGGEILSEQEVRNCIMRLFDNAFNQYIIEMSNNPDFQACTANISDEQRSRKYDQELVLRFFAFKNDRANYVHDVGEFMTAYMQAISIPDTRPVAFDYEHETRVFSKTFRVLKVTLGENAFSKMNQYKNFVSRFLSYHYEAFTLGIQKYLERLDPENGTQMRMLDEALRRVKASPDFRALTTGGGKNYPGPLRQRIEFVETNLEGIV